MKMLSLLTASSRGGSCRRGDPGQEGVWLWIASHGSQCRDPVISLLLACSLAPAFAVDPREQLKDPGA